MNVADEVDIDRRIDPDFGQQRFISLGHASSSRICNVFKSVIRSLLTRIR